MPRVSAAVPPHAPPGITGRRLIDPTWALHWGETNNANLRFKGVLGHTEWMDVFCDDERCPELHGKHMVWKMHNTCSSIKRYWSCAPNNAYKNGGMGAKVTSLVTGHGAVVYLNTGEDIIIIRPCMFEVLRAVVMFRCLLARVRAKRRARRTTFIRGTH